MCVATARAFQKEHETLMRAQRKLARDQMTAHVTEQVQDSTHDSVQEHYQEHVVEQNQDTVHEHYQEHLADQVQGHVTEAVEAQLSERFAPGDIPEATSTDTAGSPGPVAPAALYASRTRKGSACSS